MNAVAGFRASLAFAAIVLLLVTACGGTATPDPESAAFADPWGIKLVLNPEAALVEPGGVVNFTALAEGLQDDRVVFEIPEGSGAIDGDGRYVAPAAPGEYAVVATSVVNSAIRATAKVFVNAKGGNPPSTPPGQEPDPVEPQPEPTSTPDVAPSPLPGATPTLPLAPTPIPTATPTPTSTPAPAPVQVSVSPATLALPTGATATLRATVSNASSSAVAWSIVEGSEGGTVTSAGVYTAPSTPGTFHVVARSQADATKSATVNVTVTAPITAATGTPLFGTLNTPNNRRISDWEPDIRRFYALPATSTIVDSAATADLQAAFATTKYGTPYAVFGQVSYAIYYAKAGDPEYPMADIGGGVRTCPLDPPGRGVRVPAGAKRWSTPVAGTVPVIPATPGDTDIHFTVIDVERNRVYAFYSYGGETIGVVNGQFRSSTRACDLLKGDDATILAAQSYSKRYGCTGGAGYPAAGCGTSGIGAGVSAGGGFGNGDSNGFIGPHGVIMPQDFDDTGWTGDAVGTLHHALRCSSPDDYQYGYMWPMQNPMSGTPGRALRDGQIIRLDPAYDVEASGASAAEKRIMRTLQRYGCVLSDYGDYGMALFALSGWDGVGPNRGGNPWTAAGGANAEAQSFYTNVSSQGVRSNLRIPTERLQVIRPHGASYPAR